jgi:fucose permease
VTRRLFSLSVRMAACAMLLTGIGVANPRLAARLGLTLAQQGLLVSLQYVSFTVTVLFGGILSDRFGIARVLRVAMVGSAGAIVLFGFSWSYPAAVVAVLLIGAFGSVFENAVVALSMEDPATQERDGLVAGAAFAVGAVLLPAALYASISLFADWRIPFFATAVGCLALAALQPKRLSLKPVPTHRVPIAQELAPYFTYLRSPRHLIAPVAMLFYVAAEIGLWSFAPVYFEQRGFGLAAGLVASGLIWLLMMAGRLVSAPIVDRLGFRRTLIAFGGLAVASFTLAMLLPGMWAILAVAAAGFACAPFFPLILIWMNRMTGEENSASIALTMAFGTLGPVLFSGLTGSLGDRFGVQYVMLPPLVGFLIVLALLAAFGKKGEEEKPPL